MSTPDPDFPTTPTPIHDELVMEQFDREVAEYVAQFEAEDTDAMLAHEDRTAARGSTAERIAGWAILLLLGAATVGAIISGLAWIGSIVWGLFS